MKTLNVVLTLLVVCFFVASAISHLFIKRQFGFIRVKLNTGSCRE